MNKPFRGSGKRGLRVAFDYLSGTWQAIHESLFPAELAKRQRARTLAASIMRGVEAAEKAFPNDTGNYAFKRVPVRRPFNGGKPLTPEQRLAILRQLYLAHRKN
jgi:hypothetical protein